MSVAEYLARMLLPHHPLVASSFFWRMFFYLDDMHVMDCKGVAPLIFGGVLASLIRRPSLGRSQVERLGRIQRFMRQWYDDHPGTHRLPKITLTMLVLEGWADLHGPTIKAANTRQAAPLFAAAMTAEFCSEPNELDIQLREVTTKLNEFYQCIATAGTWVKRKKAESLNLAPFPSRCFATTPSSSLSASRCWRVERMRVERMQGKVWRLVLVYAKADEPDAEVVLRLGVAYQKLPLFDAQFRFPESDYPSDMGWCPCTFGQ